MALIAVGLLVYVAYRRHARGARAVPEAVMRHEAVRLSRGLLSGRASDPVQTRGVCVYEKATLLPV